MTDNKNKRWALTVYEEQYASVDELAKDDKFVKEIGWQDEVCSSTGRKHRQAYLITQQPQRFSALRSRIPGVHVEVCRDLVALKKYCSKEETRDEKGSNYKTTHPSTHVSVDKFMEMVADNVIEYCSDKTGNPPDHLGKKELKAEYWLAVGEILRFRPELAHIAMAPGPQVLWLNTRQTWLWRAQRARMGATGLVLPGSPPGAAELISHVEV